MTKQTISTYEYQVRKFKPEDGLATINQNDLRRFLYEWFTNFEHASSVGYFLAHLNDTDMNVTFPGQNPLISHSDFANWHSNLLQQTLWNYHDISQLQVSKTAPHEFLVSFIVDWYGEVKSSSDQLAGWQSREDSFIYHYTLRQIWTVNDSDQNLLIQKLVVTAADTPSPVTE